MAWGDFAEIKYFILSFDMTDEVFGKILVPDSYLNYRKASWRFMELNESLALVVLDT